MAALAVGGACVAVTTAILLAAPQAAIVGIVSLIAALLLLLPVALTQAGARRSTGYGSSFPASRRTWL